MKDKDKTKSDMEEMSKNYSDIKENLYNEDEVLYFYEEKMDCIDFDEYDDEYFKE